MKKAQDKIISLFLAPMKKKNARLKAENKRREIEQAEYQAEYEAALKAGRCVAQYGVECSCFVKTVKTEASKENNKNVSIELIICI